MQKGEISYLSLGKHINKPTANDTVCVTGYKIVCVLFANNDCMGI